MIVVGGYEGLRTKAYIPIPGDVPTVYYGETRGVRMGQSYSKAQCEAIRAGDNDERTKNLGTRVDAYGIAIADVRLHIESVCVRKYDMERVEDRINRRLDTVEHTIRNTSATILAVLGRRDHGPIR